MSKKHFFPMFSFVMIGLSMLACSLGGAPAQSPTEVEPVNPVSTDTPQAEAVPSPQASGPCSNGLFPVTSGATWTYQFTDRALGDFTRTITQVNAEGFSDQHVFTNGLTTTGEWKCSNGTLTSTNLNTGTASIQGENIDANFTTTSMEGLTLPATVQAGDTWTQNFTLEGVQTVVGMEIPAKNVTTITCTAGATESVTVPAGTFDAIRVDCQMIATVTATMNGVEIPTTITTTSTSWYAPSVGLIKSADTADGSTITFELVSYQIP